jgi:hypothetical protein
MQKELAEVLELLRMPDERGLSMAKARLALAIRYCPQTVLHWCAGRRQMGPRALEAVRKVRDELRREIPT